jgi:hypothetical protein
MDRKEAIANCGMMGPKGSKARGYLQGLLGQDPKSEGESDANGYEEAWLQGAEDRESSKLVDSPSASV